VAGAGDGARDGARDGALPAALLGAEAAALSSSVSAPKPNGSNTALVCEAYKHKQLKAPFEDFSNQH
jgi:hypothetical protein